MEYEYVTYNLVIKKKSNLLFQDTLFKYLPSKSYSNVFETKDKISDIAKKRRSI